MNFLGLITFSNFMSVLSIIMIVSASIWLFGIYFAEIIAQLSLQTIEFSLYAILSGAIFFSNRLFHPETTFIWGLLFACGLTATTFLTVYRINNVNVNTNVSHFNFANMLIHGITGVYLNSSLISAVSVMFLMTLLGFEFGFGPGYVAVGYSHHNRGLIPSATFASGVVTAMGTFIRLNKSSVDKISNRFNVFVPGMLWFGPFVFFVSLLIMSSSLYSSNREYVNNNIITLLLSLVAIFIGTVYNIPQLSGISGTFFSLFLLEKFCEFMPWQIELWAWYTLAIGVTLYVVNIYLLPELKKYELDRYFHLIPPMNVQE